MFPPPSLSRAAPFVPAGAALALGFCAAVGIYGRFLYRRRAEPRGSTDKRLEIHPGVRGFANMVLILTAAAILCWLDRYGLLGSHEGTRSLGSIAILATAAAFGLAGLVTFLCATGRKIVLTPEGITLPDGRTLFWHQISRVDMYELHGQPVCTLHVLGEKSVSIRNFYLGPGWQAIGRAWDYHHAKVQRATAAGAASARPPRKVTLSQCLLVISCFALPFYWMAAYSGPFRWLAERLAERFGTYNEGLVFVLTTALTFAVAAVAAAKLGLWRALGPGGDLAAPAGPLAADSDGDEDTAEVAREGALALEFIQRRFLQGGWPFLAVGVLLVLGGARDYWEAARAGPLTPMSLAELEAGRRPESSWLKIRGYAIKESTVETGASESSRKRFVPVASRPDPPRDAGFHLFLGNSCDCGSEPPGDSRHAADYEGLVTRGAIPAGPRRADLERRGVIKGSDYYVMDLGSTPDTKRRPAKGIILFGAGMAAIWALVGLFRRYRRRVSSPPSPPGGRGKG